MTHDFIERRTGVCGCVCKAEFKIVFTVCVCVHGVQLF